MDGRPHIISVIEYRELCSAAGKASGPRNCSRAGGVGARATGGDEAREENSAAVAQGFRLSGFRCPIASSFAPATEGNERKEDEEEEELTKGSVDEEKATAFDNYGGFELGFRCGEAELARALSAKVGVDFHEEIIGTKQPSNPFGRPGAGDRGSRDTSNHRKVRALESDSPETQRDENELREQRSISDSRDGFRANPGKGCHCENGSKGLEAGLRDGRGTQPSHVHENPAADEGGGRMAGRIAQCLGPTGPGLLAVRGVPGVAELRKKLLPLAKELALMPDDLRRLILKEHDLNTDVPLKKPDRPVSAFATQLRYGHYSRSHIECCNAVPGSRAVYGPGISSGNSGSQPKIDSVICGDKDMDELGRTLRQLGSCMVEVGTLVARLCDKILPGVELEDAIWESGTAKGRLIHYHSELEGRSMRSKISHRSSKKISKAGNENKSNSNSLNLIDNEGSDSKVGNEKSDAWQQWHYDYGLFTVLTSPMFLSWEEPSEPAQTTTATIMNAVSTSSYAYAAGDHSGLIIMHQGAARYVNIPADCLVVQVGEAAQILSGGRLAATAHYVSRAAQADVSRETFVVFLQPAWHRRLSPHCGFSSPLNSQEKGAPIHDLENRRSCYDSSDPLLPNCRGNCYQKHQEVSGQVDPEDPQPQDDQQSDLLQAVPPLSSRWRDGCTFAEFSKVTTGQYYGAHGRQSRK
ncbi:hypothetical protein MPTK1_5g07400 [Marchantia polymorpha subsp. ruderalis]|uniref:Isopenicillin N synthase-like Fe(2+) 2OG dioxygenase domain-containing protein n=2 Tax=Marchantia polymorpha TaxID=3197 RepID=A0A176WQ63_MARPO|nr:hypothetical protein AXG93_1162s1150 [Marchantia polymorpha subsp. ruderalis]PTQ30265.1 hypothetical protein MARPO_0127s0046 [Marchantia polymorpha]BBN10901.1 hypothetical protein Mp_5g07400 [Marchantia polymorpha subsp. ruderalis]|eukprot:PTQ30265.1 hypothetical protein MARPO_0127s0046 [Marchantia polymorpha]